MEKTRMLNSLIEQTARYFTGDPKRIHHFIKVYALSKTIAEQEGMDGDSLFTLEAAAIVHDIGIPEAIRKYGDGSGKYQQTEGPPIARELLEKNGFDKAVVDRVCYLVSRHHTYTDIDGLDYQILVEADFLVNIYEGGTGSDAVDSVRENIMKTSAGRALFEAMYPPKRDV